MKYIPQRCPQPAIRLEQHGGMYVILSGTGSDGAAGAELVKKAGGTVIIQNPETARYSGMPRSLSRAVVDIVAEVPDMGAIISKLLAGEDEAPPTPDAERQLRLVLDELRVRRGVDFSNYKLPTIQRRLQRRLVATAAADVASYIDYVDQHPDELNELMRAFLIKVTEFFRDDELFDHVRERLLNQLLLDVQKRGSELRIWSAGCATGQEAYSLAIIIAEHLGNELERFGVRIFATDLDALAVQFARRGVYPRTAVEHLPAELLERHFTQTNGEYEVSKRIRGMLIFGEHDLAQKPPFPDIDLILCRNVLMYFTPELQKRALNLFAFSLRDAGYLVLGKAESLSPLPEYFVAENQRLRVYRRRGGHTLIPASLVTLSRSIRGNGPQPSDVVQPPGAVTPAQDRRPAGDGLADLPVGIVVVNRQYDIQRINPMARRLLEIHVPGDGQDFIHLLRVVDGAAVRAAIDNAFRSRQPAKLSELAVADPATSSPRYVEIACHPTPPDGSDEAADFVTITVTGVSSPAATRADKVALEEDQPEQQRARQKRLDLMVQQLTELREANAALLNTNQQMTTSRHEIMADSAAVQAASEEVETLNEELHATNEELETLNEEMQATLEELHATNDDLEARGVELQRLTNEHEAQRRRFEEMVSSIGDAVLVVDASGVAALANRAYQELFGETSPAFQAELPDGTPLKASESPQQRAARGEEFTLEFMAQGADGTRRWLEAKSRPIGQDGAKHSILVIRDITDRSLRRLQEQFLAMASHELRTPLTALYGHAQLLLRAVDRGNASSDDLRKPAHLIIEQAQRLQHLVDDLVDVGRLQSGTIQLDAAELDLREMLRKSIELERPVAEPREIRLELPDEPVVVHGDSGRLEQVVLNLLDNAVTHAPGSEPIDVRLRAVDDLAEIEVQDYGQGIPAAEQQRLFTPFYQVRRYGAGSRQGLGLGLSISHEFVKAHGGRLNVSSTEGHGATFTVRLPLRHTT